jgi:hypothetical protein
MGFWLLHLLDQVCSELLPRCFQLPLLRCLLQQPLFGRLLCRPTIPLQRQSPLTLLPVLPALIATSLKHATLQRV